MQGGEREGEGEVGRERIERVVGARHLLLEELEALGLLLLFLLRQPYLFLVIDVGRMPTLLCDCSGSIIRVNHFAGVLVPAVPAMYPPSTRLTAHTNMGQEMPQRKIDSRKARDMAEDVLGARPRARKSRNRSRCPPCRATVEIARVPPPISRFRARSAILLVRSVPVTAATALNLVPPGSDLEYHHVSGMFQASVEEPRKRW